MFYAGIGSRKTPREFLLKMEKISRFLSSKGYVLRSGGALGADSAFEKGSSKSEIYLPQDASSEAKDLCLEYHPNPKAINKSEYTHSLMARNMEILLGKSLNKPVLFVICWTKNGEITGGTGQALRYCKKHNIPIFNLATDPKLLKLKDFLNLKKS